MSEIRGLFEHRPSLAVFHTTHLVQCVSDDLNVHFIQVLLRDAVDEVVR